MLLSEIPPPQTTATAAAVEVRFFGPLGEAFGRSVRVDVPAGGLTVSELRTRLSEQLGPLGEKVLSPAVRVCIDQAVSAERATVRPGQEVAFLPVFSGG